MAGRGTGSVSCLWSGAEEETVRYAEIVTEVQQSASITSLIDADRVTRATIDVLGRRLTACPNTSVAYRLPSPLASELHEEQEDAVEFGIAEFYDQVADRARLTNTEARRRARAVVRALGSVMPTADLQEIFGQLPEEYLDLLGANGRAEPAR